MFQATLPASFTPLGLAMRTLVALSTWLILKVPTLAPLVALEMVISCSRSLEEKPLPLIRSTVEPLALVKLAEALRRHIGSRQPMENPGVPASVAPFGLVKVTLVQVLVQPPGATA